MKKKAGLVLFLLAGVAKVLAVAPVNPFYPKPEINRLTYEVVYEAPSSTVSGAMVTKWKYTSELEIVRDPNVVGVIINGRDSGISPYGPVDSEYRDTCRINGNGIACTSNGFLFLNDPRALYPNQGSYYTLGDSVYFSVEDSTPFIPGLPGMWGSSDHKYYLENVGLIYWKAWSGFANQTTERILRRINGVPIVEFDGIRIRNPNIIGIKNGTRKGRSVRMGAGTYEKFILNQYLLGRQFRPH